MMKWLPWTLLGLVTIISVSAWSGSFKALSIFPVLGLLAWSIMWTHYAIGAVRIFTQELRNRLYSKVSGAIVLVCILLHPTLLAVGMYGNTSQLPPASFYNYVAPTLKYAVALGTISLIIFLSFDVFKRLSKKAWVKNNMRWIDVSQMLAMILIFVHGLALGQDLQGGWFQLWWIVMGALLIPCFGLALQRDFSSKNTSRS